MMNFRNHRLYNILWRNEQKNMRKAIQCSDGRVFTCREEAAKVTGIGKDSIWKVCNGKRPSVKGLTFSYLGVIS